MIFNKLNGLLIAFILFSTIFSTSAQDRVFARTYQSNVLNKGNVDIEIWSTYSIGRLDHFSKLKKRLEFEVGITDRLQTAFYLNMEQSTFLSKSEFGNSIITSPAEISFSNEWKYKFSDPVANIIGVALYGELTLGSKEIELEAKIILDKCINNHLFALNVVAESEFEYEYESNEKKTELENEKNKLEFDVAYMLLSKGFGAGIELQNRNKFTEGEWIYSALYAGPTISFHSSTRWWLILNLMPQLTNLKKTGSGSNLELSSNEKFDMRLLFALTF